MAGAVTAVAALAVVALVLVLSHSQDGSADRRPTSTEHARTVASPGSRPSATPDDRLPAAVLDLSDWKLTLPVSSGPHDEATEIEQPRLARFTDPKHFFVDRGDDGVAFVAPTKGATTSGSEYPRSELREMTAGGTREAGWSNARGRHVMTVTQAITSVPAKKSEVVAGQIHDSEDDVLMIRLEGEHLFVEADGDEIGDLDRHYELGTPFTVKIAATPKGIAVIYNEDRVVRYRKVGHGYYFKAGCYVQANRSTDPEPGARGAVVISALTVTHTS